MQEIAILLSSLAGVASAAVVRKIPRNKAQLLSIGASSHIKSQIRTLNIEKDILTKTISRLYQSDLEQPKIQRDKLLLKYQHQLGMILAKLEKLEQASQHPDLGPVGDGLITLMDQKLSKLDERLYDLSSRISASEISKPKIEQGVSRDKQEKTEKENIEKIRKESSITDKPKQIQETVIIPPPHKRQSFELATLTRLSKKGVNFPQFEKQSDAKQEKINVQPKPVVAAIKQKEEIINDTTKPRTVEEKIQTSPAVVISPEIKSDAKPDIVEEVAKISKHKALPEPQKPKQEALEDEFDDDSDDLDKIKGEIMSVLSKLDQAEVE